MNLLSAKTARSSKVNLLSAGIIEFFLVISITRSGKVNLLGTRIVKIRESRLLISIFKALGWLNINYKNG